MPSPLPSQPENASEPSFEQLLKDLRDVAVFYLDVNPDDISWQTITGHIRLLEQLYPNLLKSTSELELKQQAGVRGKINSLVGFADQVVVDLYYSRQFLPEPPETKPIQKDLTYYSQLEHARGLLRQLILFMDSS